MHPESFNTCKFLFHTNLSCAFINVEAISSTSYKKVKIKMLLIALLFVFYYKQPKLEGISVVTMEVENRVAYLF